MHKHPYGHGLIHWRICTSSLKVSDGPAQLLDLIQIDLNQQLLIQYTVI